MDGNSERDFTEDCDEKMLQVAKVYNKSFEVFTTWYDFGKNTHSDELLNEIFLDV